MKGERKLLLQGHLPDGVNASICARRSLCHSIDCRDGGFSTILQVRPGTHRFHFLVDGEWRISNEFATAVDSEGNLLNYFEASESSDNYEDFESYSRSGSISCSPLTTWLTIGPEPFVQKDIWTHTIPDYVARILDTTTYNGKYSSSLGDDDIMPPALPRQLEKPFLNQNHIQKDDQSVLPHPAHVVTLGDTDCRLY
jgi:Glycogen recognition site of AMP-activated protein kinase